MTESYDQQSHNKQYNSNQLRSNFIKSKKNSLVYDKEHLYSQNLDLRNRVKELVELNIKMKTQLSITEKQKINLCHIAEQQVFHPKVVQRSQSGNHKKSGTHLQQFHQNNTPSYFNNTIQKQKQNVAMKKMIREQTIQIEKLNNENQRLKKTMKYTRMNEILTENQELMNQTLRLKNIIADKKDNQNRLHIQYGGQIEALRKKLNYERDSQKRNGFELKKSLDTICELKEKVGELESKKQDAQKRLSKENRTLKSEINEMKTKMYEQASVKTRDCQRQECIATQKERNELKKKKQQLEKQLKKTKDEYESVSRQTQAKDRQLSKIRQELAQSKRSEGSKRSPPAKNQVNKNTLNESQLSSINSPQKGQQTKGAKKQEKKEQTKKQTSKPEQRDMEVSKLSDKKSLQSSKDEFKEKHYVPPKKQDNLVKPAEPAQKKPEISDSMDTDKLLQSLDESKPNQLNIESATKNKQKEPLYQSDGQYEELDYDDFEPEEQKTEEKKEKKAKKEKKDKQGEKKKKDKNKDKDKQTKVKQKSTKKMVPVKRQLDDDEQMLYSANNDKVEEKGQEDNKAELKMIKETLFYKFMAQNYSYDNFCNDIKSSEMKQFSISDLINLMGTEPFLLSDHQVEIILMYIFDTDNPTGNQVISIKEFIKKMKKFIGKTKEINEEKQSNNLRDLSELIQNDLLNGQKLKKKFIEKAKGGSTLTVEQFSKVMESFKVKGEALQTAIAHIAVVSQDLNSLDYNQFLLRFTPEE